MKTKNKFNPLRVKDLVNKYGSEKLPIKTMHPEPIYVDRMTTDANATGTVSFYDGNTKILTIDKKKLYDAYVTALNENGAKGITWLVPLYKYAFPIEYHIEHSLRVEGDTAGLIMWLDSKLL